MASVKHSVETHGVNGGWFSRGKIRRSVSWPHRDSTLGTFHTKEHSQNWRIEQASVFLTRARILSASLRHAMLPLSTLVHPNSLR